MLHRDLLRAGQVQDGWVKTCGECCFDPCTCKAIHKPGQLDPHLGPEPDQVCTRKVWHTHTVCETVPCTTYVKESVCEKIPYTVCKKVPHTRPHEGALHGDSQDVHETVTKQVPYTVTKYESQVCKKMVPYTVTKCIPDCHEKNWTTTC